MSTRSLRCYSSNGRFHYGRPGFIHFYTKDNTITSILKQLRLALWTAIVLTSEWALVYSHDAATIVLISIMAENVLLQTGTMVFLQRVCQPRYCHSVTIKSSMTFPACKTLALHCFAPSSFLLPTSFANCLAWCPLQQFPSRCGSSTFSLPYLACPLSLLRSHFTCLVLHSPWLSEL